MKWARWLMVFWAGCVIMPAAQSATLESAGRRVIAVDGAGKVEVEYGVLRVPESRVKTTDREIGIPWYRLTSTAEHPATPIFMLAGGPGASGLDQMRSAEVFKEVEFYRSIADVVVFDQRGAGHSTPAMTCPQTAHYPNDQALDWHRLRKIMQTLLTACRDQWLQQGVDLSAYNTLENAADVNDLREALGYDSMTLIGGSYGSHLALQVMRLYPKLVDRAVLYGVEGPDHTWDDPDGLLAALKRIDQATQRHATQLGLQMPEGGVLGALSRVLKGLQADPREVTVMQDGKPVRVVVDAILVRLMARHKAGSHDHPKAWPRMILAMDRGDFSLAAKAALDYRHLQLADPMHWSMDCASGISPVRRNRYRAAPAVPLLGVINREYVMLCDLWPARDLGSAYRADLVSSIPTLIVHGTWDTSTPIENAREVAATLRNAQLITVIGGNHGALYNLYEHWPPMRAQMRAFLSGHHVKLPSRVVMPWVAAPVTSNP